MMQNNAIIAATHVELRCFVASIANSLELVEETVQSTYVTAYQQFDTYEARATLLPWLKGIARNLLRRELRQRQRFVTADTPVFDQLLIDDGLVRAQQDEAAVDALGASLQHLDACLGELSPAARRLLDGCYQDALTLNQLAQRFRRKRTVIAMSLSRIRSALRTCLQRRGVVG